MAYVTMLSGAIARDDCAEAQRCPFRCVGCVSICMRRCFRATCRQYRWSVRGRCSWILADGGEARFMCRREGRIMRIEEAST